MKAIVSTASRHLVVRLEEGELLPDALMSALGENAVATGWLRASGIVAEAEIKAFRSDHASLGTSRRIAGPVQVLSLEGSVGLANGNVTVGLRAVIARETESGLETIAGELVSARVVAVEAIVTALDDVACGRAIDDRTGIWLLDPAPSSDASSGGARIERPREAPTRPDPPAPPAAWAQAVAASNERPPSAQASEPIRAPIPQRPQKPSVFDGELVYPEAGDIVEHFAFGRCEVLKSDGDRLHLKVGKDGRIREIALEMLRVTPLESNEEGRKRYKLDRKL